MPIVPPAVNPAINVMVPVHLNPLYNPNPYFNPMVPSVPFVHPPPVFVGPPPYHPPMVHSSPINPNSSSQSASQVAGGSMCHSSSRDISQLSSPLYDSDQTRLKEVAGSTKSSTMYFEGHADSQKVLEIMEMEMMTMVMVMLVVIEVSRMMVPDVMTKEVYLEIFLIEIIEKIEDIMIGIGGMEIIIMAVIKIRVIEIKIKVTGTKIKVI